MSRGRTERWRERLPEELTCIRCLEVKPAAELDRLLWCDACVARARRRATFWGWISGAALAGILALYIWLVIQPDLSLIPTGWLATLVVAFYLGGRIARELILGVMRVRNQRAVEAAPPSSEQEGRPPSG